MSYVVGIDGGGTKTTCVFKEIGCQNEPSDSNLLIILYYPFIQTPTLL